MTYSDEFFDSGHESLLYFLYTHFRILNQMMDALSFVLDIAEECQQIDNEVLIRLFILSYYSGLPKAQSLDVILFLL